MHKENTDKHNALLKCAEIINYFEGKVQHQQKPIETTNEVVQLTIPREQFLQNMLDPLKIEVGYNTAQFHHAARKDETLINNCVAVGLLAPRGTNTRQGGQALY